MKGIFAILIVVAIAAAWYYVPASHHQADTGTYFVRDYISFKTPSGVVGWGPGQEIHEDIRAPYVEGSKTVTDGKFTAIIPEGILTQDIEDAEVLRVADNAEQSKAKSDLAALKTRIAKQAFSAQVASAQDMLWANAVQVAASTVGMSNTALNVPARPVGYYGWDDSSYYTHRIIYIVRPPGLTATPAPVPTSDLIQPNATSLSGLSQRSIAPLLGVTQRSATPAPLPTPAVISTGLSRY